MTAITATGGKLYTGHVAINSDITPAKNTVPLVIEDPVVSNNGVYAKVSDAGSGSWSRVGDVPGYQFVRAENVGAGTPNAIVATSALPISGDTLVYLPVAATNTASPVTVSFDGGAALTVKTNSGSDVVVGGLVAGMVLLGVVSGAVFRLVSDQASAAVVAAAEDAADRAEAAANSNATYLNVAQFVASEIHSSVTFVRTAGYNAPGDGGGAMYTRLSAEPSPVQAWHKQSADGAWWMLSANLVMPQMFGATLSAPDNSTAFIACGEYLSSKGGGNVEVSVGQWFAAGIILYSGVYWRGSGKGSTRVKQPNGANKDVFITKDFAALTGVGPTVNGPMNFGVSGITIDGNYLNNWLNFNGSETVNNTQGYGMKIFGTRFDIDVEIVNVPKVGFYSETSSDYAGYTEEATCHVKLSGRVFGQEAVVFRGPGDILFEFVVMGVPFWQPTLALRQTVIPTSDLFGAETHLFVADETAVGALEYTGHHEFTFMHLYGNLYGHGYYMNGAGRVNGGTLITENNRGGAYLGARRWGGINQINCWNLGRSPISAGGAYLLAPLPAIDDNGNTGARFNANVLFRNVASRTDAGPDGLVLRGSGGSYTFSYFPVNQSSGQPPLGTPLRVLGDDNTATVNIYRARANAIEVSGNGNHISGNVSNVNYGGSALKNDASAGGGERNIYDLNANNVDNYLEFLGQPWDFMLRGTFCNGPINIRTRSPT